MIQADTSAEALAAELDSLDASARLEAVRALPRGALPDLYDLCHGRAAGLAELVPAEIADGVPVRHFGLNSLALFRRFEKRFLRTPDGGSELWGYNEQAMRALTGPGYFVVPAPAPGEEAGIDYRRVPPRTPDCGWPAVRTNERGLARLVYGGMVDTLRRVSEGVCIGRAHKGGEPFDAWFVLVRESLTDSSEPR